MKQNTSDQIADKAIKDPAKIYNSPQDVLNDNRLTNQDKGKILESWELDENRLLDSESESMNEDVETEDAAELLQAIQKARASLKA